MSISRPISLLLFLASASVFSQDETPTAPPDSSQVIVRQFDDAQIEELKNDSELNYEQAPAAVSLWQRFKIWLGNLLDRLLDAAFSANWFNILIMILLVIILVYVILRLLKVNALRMFYGNTSAAAYGVLEEDIHSMDFEKMLQDALQRNEFRLAIRLLFLQSLKLLSDKHHIHWMPGKTNHDYLNELNAPELKTGFNELNFYFEYAWYGNFRINAELYTKVNSIFMSWRTNV